MKYKAGNINISEIEIEIDGIPELIYEELEIAMNDDLRVFVAGPHLWNRLTTEHDMSQFYGQWFNLSNDEWKLDDCIILSDKKTIFFRNAEKI